MGIAGRAGERFAYHRSSCAGFSAFCLWQVLIPAYLRQFAGIDGEVTVVGMNTYIEIWSPETWQAIRQGVEDDEGNVERWAELGI
jgi:hypothetical protein